MFDPITPLPTFPEMTDVPAAPQNTNPTDIPPTISNPQTPKRKSGRILATILGILLLVGAVGTGVVLIGQNQDIREKASCIPDGQCITIKGQSCCNETIFDSSCPAVGTAGTKNKCAA
ncbi:MAG: hypothetical protein AAB954_01330, partial [Patescibacteria group bacterium]